jgi:glyoxylase-like metal-dependent hydrolase (beta-lactamase superfamily II)
MSLPRASAEDWYITRRVGDDVTYIGEPFIKEFYRCNMWHVRGRDRDLLVDSGMGVVSLRQHVPLVTEKRCLAVASHTHFDHVGCHHEFEDRYVHSAECHILENPTPKNTLSEPYVQDDIFTQLPPMPYQSREYSVKRAPATVILLDGDTIDLGDRRFEVIHTPGHSPGGIALYERSAGILFTGDILYDGPLIEDCFHSDPDAYIASMRRLLDIKPRVVHGGHFPSFDGRRFRTLILDWLAQKDRP